MFGFGAAKLPQIHASELQKQLEGGAKPLIIDVREPWEYAEGHIPGSLLRPLGQIRTWAGKLNPQDEIVVYCRTASRSASATQYLQTAGFKNVKNMSGGIISWRGKVER